jgi:hypothetical protein
MKLTDDELARLRESAKHMADGGESDMTQILDELIALRKVAEAAEIFFNEDRIAPLDEALTRWREGR